MTWPPPRRRDWLPNSATSRPGPHTEPAPVPVPNRAARRQAAKQARKNAPRS